MSHDDLRSVGVDIFGARHKILKAAQDFRSLSKSTIRCEKCEISMLSQTMLERHICLPMILSHKLNAKNVKLPCSANLCWKDIYHLMILS